jgi:hypothetical protein
MTHSVRLPWTRRWPAAALLCVVVLATGTAGALAHGPDPALGGALFDQDQALLFSWRSGAQPPTVIKTAIRAASIAATASRASKAASFAYAASGPNPIGYGTSATCSVNGLACFTRTAPTGFTMWFREQGHVFDWGTLRWCQLLAAAANGCFDAETIALDEFGHVEGLDHHVNYSDDRDYEDAVVQTVSRARPAAGWNARAFGACDTATLQRRYDLATWGTKVSDCLDLASTLTLTASPAWVAYGGTVSLTAVLKIADSDTYGRLALDPLSGRTVSLQRRVTGTTAWVAAGIMTAGPSAGTYIASARLVTGSEFRAVFAAPASEGLRGATSATFRVVVGGCAGQTCPLAPPAAVGPAASMRTGS